MNIIPYVQIYIYTYIHTLGPALSPRQRYPADNRVPLHTQPLLVRPRQLDGPGRGHGDGGEAHQARVHVGGGGVAAEPVQAV